MSFWNKAIFIAIILATATACGNSPTAPTPTTVSATIDGGGFSPNPINISVGSTVMWTNKDGGSAHAVVADNGAFSSGAIAPGAQYTYTFPSAGTFTYHDTATSMAGTVNVSGSSSSPY